MGRNSCSRPKLIHSLCHILCFIHVLDVVWLFVGVHCVHKDVVKVFCERSGAVFASGMDRSDF